MLAICGCVLLIGLTPLRQVARNVFHDAAYRLDPTAERAFAYGELHFNALDRYAYDIDRAEFYLKQAALKDPTMLYVQHELARISFLRGDFTLALAKINFQIDMHGDSTPNSYYIRGLIEGFMGKYADSARDYERYLEFDPYNWAALNDYAWILLKDGRHDEALAAAERGLAAFPDNVWLLNSRAIALYEIGYGAEALVDLKAAQKNLQSVTTEDWLLAYPGNDPRVAAAGLRSFKGAVDANIHMMETGAALDTLQ